MDKPLENIKMKELLKIEDEKIQRIMEIKLNYLKGNIPLEEAKRQMNSSFDEVTAQEFAICEQYLHEYGISDDELTEKLDEILKIFEDVLVSNKLNLPPGHPVSTYLEEVKAIRAVLAEMREMLNKKFIKNKWLEIYDKLQEIKTHFDRKQNQLYPALEKKDFDKPSKIMWTLENDIEDIINRARGYLDKDQDDNFLEIQEKVIDMIEDMMVKEEEVLYPTSIDLISEEEFIEMRKGDHEIGYCLIEDPPPFAKGKDRKENELDSSNEELLKDLSKVLKKHGVLDKSSNNGVLEVSQGKLTLEQINLIFKHLQVDLSYVDENEICKFYSDTEHRVFPRSPGVIGRKVQNCHPRESVDTVEEIIEGFRSGEHDEAEFWIDTGDKFIYIIYNAVRDDDGNFKGVLEMMQDVTRIRSLEGNQRLLSWGDKSKNKKKEESKVTENKYGINEKTLIGDLVKKYPFIKDFLFKLSPKFNKLKNPVIFKTMSTMATLEMISKRGNFKVKELIDKIVEEIDNQTK